jgi:hypothetical protein
MGPIGVQNHVGINNDFVVNTLGGAVSPFLTTPGYYASQYPLFKFSSLSSFSNPGTLSLSTTSYFKNLGFRQSASNTVDVYIFNFLYISPDKYQY